MIFKTRQIYVAYSNTILRTLFGTLLSCIAHRRSPPFLFRSRAWRGTISFFHDDFLTMLFNGGLISTFLVVQALGLLDTFLTRSFQTS